MCYINEQNLKTYEILSFLCPVQTKNQNQPHGLDHFVYLYLSISVSLKTIDRQTSTQQNGFFPHLSKRKKSCCFHSDAKTAFAVSIFSLPGKQLVSLDTPALWKYQSCISLGPFSKIQVNI